MGIIQTKLRMNIPSQHKARRNHPRVYLCLIATLLLLSETTFARTSHPKPRNLSTAEVWQKLPTLPGEYLTQLSTKHNLKECSLSTTKCGQNNEYKYCSEGCCNWDGVCEKLTYCPDNGFGNYNLRSFNECVYEVLNFQGDDFAKELPKIASFEKDVKVALETCPASKRDCGSDFGNKFCTSGCCSDDGYCGNSQVYCFGNVNEKFDGDKLTNCLEDIGHGFVAAKNDGSPTKDFKTKTPDAPKSNPETPEPSTPAPQPETEEPTAQPEPEEPTLPAEPTEVPKEDPVPTEPEVVVVTGQANPAHRTLNRKIHDLVYSLMFISIFAFVFTYYVLPAMIYCCALRKRMAHAKFNKSRCFIVSLTLGCPWVMVI